MHSPVWWPWEAAPEEELHPELQLLFFLLVRYTLFCKRFYKTTSLFSNKIIKYWQMLVVCDVSQQVNISYV